MHKPNDCFGCPLASISDGYILPEGEGSNGVVVLGEGAGWNEYVDGLPFRPHGQAGSKLEEGFREVSKELGYPVSRNQFLIYNTVNCHPPGDQLAGMPWEQGAIAHCARQYVDKVVGGFKTDKIKTILALGNIALKATTGFSGVAEEKQSVTHLRGYVFPGKYGMVVPSLHPSFIRRGNNHLTPLLVEDIKKALAVAKGQFTNYKDHISWVAPKYQVMPGLDDCWQYYARARDNRKLPIAYDIETVDSAAVDEDERDELVNAEIVQIQFSLAPGEGIAIPWRAEYMQVISAMLALPNSKLNWNGWHFDDPRIKAKGIEINGKIHDVMWMWKHYQPRLPRGLQAVSSLFNFPYPWKHLYNVDLAWYGCADVDSLQSIAHTLPQLMNQRGVWEGYVRHVQQLNPIFSRASERGIPVSTEKHTEVHDFFIGERKKVDAELQDAIPDDIRNIQPKRKLENGGFDYGYVREPKIVGECRDIYADLAPRLEREGNRVISFEEFVTRKYNKQLEDKKAAGGKVKEGELVYATFKGHEGEIVERWCVIEDFKASSTQLQRYLKWKQEEIQQKVVELREKRLVEFGGRNPELTQQIKELEELAGDYEIPINLKTKRATTGKQDLEEIFFNTGDRVLELTMKVRSLDTNLNNYLPNWTPGKDGCVHPVYGYTAPSGQINSWGPNSQNVSKHTEYGKIMRGVVQAPKGYTFVEADKKSFHVATMGYCANDRSYIRFSQIDPHSILGSHIDPSIIGGSISLKWSDGDIKAACKEFKKKCKEAEERGEVNVRQALAKPTVLGNQLELGAKKLQRQNQRFIHTILQAERLQDVINGLFDKPRIYKGYIKELAFKQRYLTNEFGRIDYFWDVFQFKKDKKTGKWERKEGEGARHPIAFRVQSTAFGMITEELLTLAEMGFCEEHNFMVTIHDSLLFMPEVGKLDKCIEGLRDVMSRPCRKLVNDATGAEGLKVGVEISVGENWKEMKEV